MSAADFVMAIRVRITAHRKPAKGELWMLTVAGERHAREYCIRTVHRDGSVTVALASPNLAPPGHGLPAELVDHDTLEQAQTAYDRVQQLVADGTITLCGPVTELHASDAQAVADFADFLRTRQDQQT